MAYKVLDGDGAELWLDADGAGTNGDPAQPRSADAAAIRTALEGTLTVDGSGVTQPVSAASLPLPTGASTETTLAAVQAAVEGTMTVDGSGTTQPVSAASLPLPTGASTETTLAAVLAELQATLITTEEAVSLTHVAATIAASGDNEVIAAPGAGTVIVISAIMVQNESDQATTSIVKDGATAIWRVLGQNQGDGLALTFAAGREWRLSDNEALVVNLSGANSHGVSVAYWTE